ncbi:MAG: hypothetical protein IPK52_00080 [Chloroflexi bacterium]|nr:hypothetical protein [Chloroflexota bacterium]
MELVEVDADDNDTSGPRNGRGRLDLDDHPGGDKPAMPDWGLHVQPLSLNADLGPAGPRRVRAIRGGDDVSLADGLTVAREFADAGPSSIGRT